MIGGHAHPSGNEGSEIALKVLKISHERFVLGDSHGIVEEGGQRIASNFAGAKISEDTYSTERINLFIHICTHIYRYTK
jgi:UDP-N-acetyl-D-mannosaminuronic acid transferase (WecB/TagA/CpsF family)